MRFPPPVFAPIFCANKYASKVKDHSPNWHHLSSFLCDRIHIAQSKESCIDVSPARHRPRWNAAQPRTHHHSTHAQSFAGGRGGWSDDCDCHRAIVASPALHVCRTPTHICTDHP